MNSYKIKVNNEAESKESQKLFFELGYKWSGAVATYLSIGGFKFITAYQDEMRLAMGWGDDADKELTLPQLRDLVAQKQGLISWADALRALADGKEVEVRFKDNIGAGWYSPETLKQMSLEKIINGNIEFRLKPRTIKLELEIPAPFEPKAGDIYYYIHSSNLKGYGFTKSANDGDDECLTFYGAWRTEEEIKKVVAAFRGGIKA